MATSALALSPAPDEQFEKRDAALEVVGRFIDAVTNSQHASAVLALTRETVSRLEQMQVGSPRHFAKSLSRLANTLRRAGYVEQAISLLQWAESRELLDQYLVDDLVRCHLAQKDLQAVEAVAGRAERLRLHPVYALASLARAHSRSGEAGRVPELCERAVRAGVGSDLTFGLLIEACGTRDVSAAASLFAVAAYRRVDGAAAHSALAAVYFHAGVFDEVERVFLAAKSRGLVSVRLCTVMVKTLAKLLRLVDAGHLLDEAAASGWDDPRAYAALIQAHIDHHGFKEAREWLRRAHASGNADDGCYARVIAAYAKAGYAHAARRLYRQARAGGYAGDTSRRAMSLAERNAGRGPATSR